MANLLFCVLCALWYLSSASANTSAKGIFMRATCPYSLTLLQFLFVSVGSAISAIVCGIYKFNGALGGADGIKRPSRAVIANTFVLSLFQVGGHIFSSLATSRIRVATVHTIKVRYLSHTITNY